MWHLAFHIANNDVRRFHKQIKPDMYNKSRKAYTVFFIFHGSQILVGLGLRITEISRSHTDTPHPVGLLCMSDRPIAETSSWQHTQHSQESNTNAPVGVEISNPSKQAPVNLRFRPRGNPDEHIEFSDRSKLHNKF